MQIPKKTQILFNFPVLHSKAILLQVVIFFHNNAKKTLVQGMEDRVQEEEN